MRSRLLLGSACVLALAALLLVQLDPLGPGVAGDAGVTEAEPAEVAGLGGEEEEGRRARATEPTSEGTPAASRSTASLADGSNAPVRVNLLAWDFEAAGPAAQVTVQIARVADTWPWETLGHWQTDAQGELELRMTEDMVLRLRLERGSDFLLRSERIGPFAAGEHELRIELHPVPPFGFDLRVVDGAGVGVAEAEVRAPYGDFPDLRTDAGGRARVEAREEWGVAMTVEREGFAPTYQFVESPDETVVIELLREAVLRGRVLDRRGGAIEGAEVRLRAPPQAFRHWGDLSLFERVAVTDRAGTFRLEAIWPQLELDALVEADGLALREIVGPLGPGEHARDFVVDDRPVLAGIVVDAAGAPLAGVAVEAAPQVQLKLPEQLGPSIAQLDVDEPPFPAVVTGEDGRFAFREGLVPGWWVVATHGTWRMRRIPAEAVTDRNRGLLPGWQRVELGPGEKREDLRLVLDAALSIRGTLLDPGRQPMDEGFVTANPENWNDGWAVTTHALDADGSFEIGPLSPGRYTIHGGSYVRGLEAESQVADAGATGIVLACGEQARISGRVVDAAGEGALALVYAFTEIDGESEMWAPNVGGDGRFEIVVHQPLRWDFFAFARSGEAAALGGVPVAPGEVREVELRLEPGVPVAFTLPEEEYEDHAKLFHRGALLWEGEPFFLSDFERLPEGDLRVEFWRDGKLFAEADAVLLAGQAVELVLESDS